MLKRVLQIAQRECCILYKNPMYGFCMVVFPLFIIFFFTSLMNDGQPFNMPVGVVDQDNTSTSRQLIRNLDAYQNTDVVAHYANMNDARQAIQRNEIYAFLLIPKDMSADLVAGRQPNVSFYYSSVSLVAGSTLFKDLKTITSLASASVAATKLSALGKTNNEIKTFIQPIAIDLHMINNPWANYNVYLSTSMIPGVLLLFIFLITVYSLGTELKFKESKKWMSLANNNIYLGIFGKMLPQTLIFLCIFYAFEFYVYYILGFPHQGGALVMLLLGLLSVLAAQGFGVFVFGIIPSLRMSMSVCSLWGVLSFTMAGATYPVFAMNPMIEAIAQLFPLRHYYMIYQMSVFNGYPLLDTWYHLLALCIFIVLPLFTLHNIKRAMLVYKYMP